MYIALSTFLNNNGFSSKQDITPNDLAEDTTIAHKISGYKFRESDLVDNLSRFNFKKKKIIKVVPKRLHVYNLNNNKGLILILSKEPQYKIRDIISEAKFSLDGEPLIFEDNASTVFMSIINLIEAVNPKAREDNKSFLDGLSIGGKKEVFLTAKNNGFDILSQIFSNSESAENES